MIYRDEACNVPSTWNRTNKFTATRRVVIYADAGLPEVEEYLRDNPARWSANSSATNPASSSWDLKAGLTGAMAMARDGWHEGVADIDQRLHAIIPASGREARWGWGVTGGSVNVNRFLTGHPKSMRSRRKKMAGSAPVLHIVVNGTASCAVTGQQMANYGCAIAGLIDRLENTGRRVMVDVAFAIALPHHRYATRLICGWNVKRASEALDLSAVAFSVAHPAAFRRLGFALMERSPSECEDYCYGYSADILQSDIVDGDDGTMLVDGVGHSPNRCNSPQDALRLAIEQINKAAVLAGHATPDNPLIPEDEELFAYA